MDATPDDIKAALAGGRRERHEGRRRGRQVHDHVHLDRADRRDDRPGPHGRSRLRAEPRGPDADDPGDLVRRRATSRSSTRSRRRSRSRSSASGDGHRERARIDCSCWTPARPLTCTSPAGRRLFTIHFDTGIIGPASPLTALLTPLLINTGAGNDDLRVQANTEPLFYLGGDGGRQHPAQRRRATNQPLTQADVVPTITGSVVDGDAHVQQHPHGERHGGQFALQYGTAPGSPVTIAFGYDVAPELIQADAAARPEPLLAPATASPATTSPWCA